MKTLRFMTVTLVIGAIAIVVDTCKQWKKEKKTQETIEDCVNYITKKEKENE